MDIRAGLNRPKIDVHSHVATQPNSDASADALIASGEIPSVSQSTGVLALLAAAASPLWMKSAIATMASCAPQNTVRTTSGACVMSFRVTEEKPLPKSNAVWEPA